MRLTTSKYGITVGHVASQHSCTHVYVPSITVGHVASWHSYYVYAPIYSLSSITVERDL